ncbi:methyltransferase domain-containing protein, partial [Acinetobacter baumannii]
YLKETGFTADGVDISQAMIERSKDEDSSGCYSLIENGRIPAKDGYYDLVLSTLVLFEISTLQEMKESFQEIYRTMRFN